MKFLCEWCGQLGEPSGVTVVDGAPAVTCAACARSTKLGGPATPAAAPHPKLIPAPSAAPRAPAAPTQLQAVPAELEQLRAQKGGKTRLSHGLKPARAEGDGVIAKGWNALLDRWEDDEAHEQLLQVALLKDGLAELGALYTSHLQGFPQDDRAKAARERLVERASTRYLAQLPSEERGITHEHANQVRNVAVGVVIIGLAGLALFLWRIYASRG